MRSSIKTRSKTISSTSIYLPDECWELVFKFIINNDSKNQNSFESISLVSKQFLSITNCLRFSLVIYDQTHTFLRHLFKRFNNLTSLDLTHFHGDLNAILHQISRCSLNLTSLNLSNQHTIPTNGLRAFSQKITTLTSLSCSKMNSINSSHLLLIAHCFPLLEQLDLSNPLHIKNYNGYHSGLEALSLELTKLRKVNLSGHHLMNSELFSLLFRNCKLLEEAIVSTYNSYNNTDVIVYALCERPTLRSLSFSNTSKFTYPDATNVTSEFIASLVSLKGLTCLDLSNWQISNELLSSIAMEGLPLRRLALQSCTGYDYAGIFSFLSKCQCIQHLDLQKTDFLIDQYVVKLSSFLINLVSINLNHCCMITNSSLFALVKNCPSLSEIKMEYTGIGTNSTKSVENSVSLIDFVANPQLKSLYLTHNSCLGDESIIIFASIFPNLELLDLSYCKSISEGICQVLKKCCKIRHLNLAHCSRVTLLELNFEVSKLEVLNLSHTMVDDKTLYVISKNCCRILQLLLEHCIDVTNKGVKHVIENCTQLKEINLDGCLKVHSNGIASMVSSRPSLRKISTSST